jgi:hypothetical protein
MLKIEDYVEIIRKTLFKEDYVEIIKKILFFDVFPFICHLLGCLLIAISLYRVGFPPSSEIGTTSPFLALLGTFFLLIPIANKISLGKLLSFEREVEKVKEEVKEFRVETKEFLGVYSNMISAISNTVKQTVNVHYHPGTAEVQKAKKSLKGVLSSPEEEKNIEDETFEFIAASGDDYNFALAKIRMELEKQLREVLGRKTITADPIQMKSGFLSARQLFREFEELYPEYKNMRYSWDYVLKICNAAIHGQQVSEGHAQEAISMGLRIIETIKTAGSPP